MSKLPRLSQSPAPPPPEPTDPPVTSTAPPGSADPGVAPAPPGGYALNPRSSLADAWIGIAIGALLLFMVPNTILYTSSKLFGTTFAPFPDPTRPYPAKADFIMYTDGTKVFYRDLPNFWSDLAVTAFALVLIVNSLVLALARNAAVVAIAFGFTVSATAANLLWLVGSYREHGLALFSAVAVIFGVYVAIQQWALLQLLRPRR